MTTNLKKDNEVELPIINLFGDQEEAFYQLGLKDSLQAKSTSAHIRNLISTPWSSVNTMANKTLENFFSRVLYKDIEFENLLKAYSDGSGLSEKEFLHSLIIPEVCSFLSKWLPKISTLQFGCSSLFTVDEQGNPIHARILDFPLKGTYDQNERIVRSNYKGSYQVLNYSTTGLPFSGLTSMNEKGLTLAIHQKFTDKFDQHGTPIFYLAHKLIHHCSNIEDALHFLKGARTITCWNFNLMDKEGNVLEADLAGDKLTYNTYNVFSDGPIYICNELVDDQEQEKLFPLSIKSYNDMRKKTAGAIIGKLNGEKAEKILKEFSSPKKSKTFSISPITVSSMASVLFSPAKDESFYIPGQAPKIFTGKVRKISNIWNKISQTGLKLRSKEYNLQIQRGLNHLIKAQSYFDNNDHHSCYHTIQMAIDELEDCDEGMLKFAEFYFIVLQYIDESHATTLKQIQKDLSDITASLSPYLQDVAKIIDQRIAILTDGHRYNESEFTFKKLKERYDKEAKFNKMAHHTLKKLTFIHLDIMDVIFA